MFKQDVNKINLNGCRQLLLERVISTKIDLKKIQRLIRRYFINVMCIAGVVFFFTPCLADNTTRIVSLDLCTDWMLLKYASRSQIVTYSPLLYRYPLDWVPEGLPVHDGSLEQILLKNPDRVITGEFNAMLLTKRLRQLGKNVEIIPLPRNLSSVVDYNSRFKSLLQNSQILNDSLTPQQFEYNGKSLLLLGANGIGSGKGTLENDIVEKSGWNNYIQQAGFVSLDLEKIVHQPPDAVLWSKPVSNSLANLFARHSVLSNIINLHPTNENESWRWQCPGPWTFDLITELATWKKH